MPAAIAPTTLPSPLHENTLVTCPTETSQLYAKLGSVGPVIEVKKPCAIRAAATTPIKMYVNELLVLSMSFEIEKMIVITVLWN